MTQLIHTRLSSSMNDERENEEGNGDRQLVLLLKLLVSHGGWFEREI